MEITDLIKRNRSFRRFEESKRISKDKLSDLVELARFSASGTNKQALKYYLISSEEECARIFPFTRWAGYLKDWAGPVKGERPAAYIVILGDRDISDNYFVDHGIAAQSMLLGAVEAGFGGCMIGSIDRKGLKDEFSISDRFEILLIIALGLPVEKVIVDDVKGDDIKYWRDSEDVHHVPKRTMDELILKSL